MGVDLSQYRSAIGNFMGKAATVGPRARAKKKSQWVADIWKQGVASSHIQMESNGFWHSIWQTQLFTFICLSGTAIAMILHTWFLLTLQATTPDIFLEAQTLTSSTMIDDNKPDLKDTTTDSNEAIRLSLALASVVRLLLVRYGVERKPGPIFQPSTTVSLAEERWGRLGNGLNTTNRFLQTYVQTMLSTLFYNLPR